MNELQQRLFTVFSIPVYAIFIPLEIILSNFRHLGFYSLKESLVNIYLNLLNAGIDQLLRFLIGLSVIYFFYQYRIDMHLNPVAYWTLLLLGEDFIFWLEHFADHNCRLFWAVHVTHHSSPE